MSNNYTGGIAGMLKLELELLIEDGIGGMEKLELELLTGGGGIAGIEKLELEELIDEGIAGMENEELEELIDDGIAGMLKLELEELLTGGGGMTKTPSACDSFRNTKMVARKMNTRNNQTRTVCFFFSGKGMSIDICVNEYCYIIH